ncbi:MAG: SIR2 family protein, partial [Magnetococcales bacterium]|nr:SIR2 family protein [Magnetococcales bacterium]
MINEFHESPAVMSTLTFLTHMERKRLERFRDEDLPRGRGVLLFGAGMAVAAGLPSGAELANRLNQEFGLDLPANLTLPEVCDRAAIFLPVKAFRSGILAIIDDEAVPLPVTYQLAARMNFAEYLTTNVDRLLEWSLRDARKLYTLVISDEDLSFIDQGARQRVPLTKVHGSLDHPHTLAFTTLEMDSLPDKRSRLFDHLRETAARKSMLIMGFALNDPDLLGVFRAVEQAGGGDHILVDCGRSPEERERLRQLGCLLVDPGPGQFERYAEILGYLSNMDPSRLAAIAGRRPRRANPFPGLAPYPYRAPRFTGREEKTVELAAGLPATPPVTVFFGESGCGKSSFFNAGVTPYLEQQGAYLPVLIRPPALPPLEAGLAREALSLADATVTLPLAVEQIIARAENRGIFLIIDQFEQVFHPPFFRGNYSAPRLKKILDRVFRCL